MKDAKLKQVLYVKTLQFFFFFFAEINETAKATLIFSEKN